MTDVFMVTLNCVHSVRNIYYSRKEELFYSLYYPCFLLFGG